MSQPDVSNELLRLTADIVSAHVSNNSVSFTGLPGLIGSVYASLAGLGTKVMPDKVHQEPAVSVRSSIKPGYLVCLEDGKKLTLLKRYLRTKFGMTPDAYRTKWSLPVDYPMVAPAYSVRRQSLALQNGLGRKKQAETPAPQSPPKKKSRLPRTELAPLLDKGAT